MAYNIVATGATSNLFKIEAVNTAVNGVVHKILDTNVTLANAPTVLPYDAVLTTEQIASGVIKHADSSNSGLVSNGKNLSGTTFTQTITTVNGKSYTLEKKDNGVYSTSTFTASGATYNISLSGTNITEVAVFPADAISRSDLVFPESWHEDISEKDFVYPLGNVQYLGTTGDSGAPVVGAFAGSATYSLFSDTWQADGALVGKGYVWSALSDVNKKAFAANPENNCYLDGNKVIQVRYRMRVVQGFEDSWMSIDPQISYLQITSGLYVRPKGKQVSHAQGDVGINADINGVYGNKLNGWTNLLAWNDNGVWVGADAYGDTNGYLSGSYNGQIFALPIALVHRRNQGGYNATYNPNGTKAMTMTPTSIADCFNTTNLNIATGYIGTSTPRPDGLFYDQVSVEDFKPSNKGADLRNSSKKRTAQSLIEEFAPKALASTIPYYNNDTTALTTYKDTMEVRDTSGNRYPLISKVGNVVTIGATVANKKGFSIVTKNGKQYLQVADDVASDATVQMNLSTVKYDIGVFDA